MLKGVTTTGLSLGDILFYNSNTNASAGTLTTTQPEAPNAKIQIAAVVRESTGGGLNGELLVRVQTPVSLKDDSSVQFTNVANGEVLAFNGTANRWENKEVVSLGLNVALTNIANDQYLAYNNGTWVNRDLNAVTTTQITNWDNTYNIVDANAGNWNSAFSWGNHQAVGYIVGLANNTVTDNNISAFNGTTGKLLKDTGVAISSVNTAIAHTTLTNNPHSVTKTQVGLANVADVLQATTATFTATITANGWSGAGPFTKAVTVTGITATDNPIVDLDLSGVTFANVPTTQTAWGKIYRGETSTNTITFYATEALTVDMPFTAKVVR
jgi:hypothetical protein